MKISADKNHPDYHDVVYFIDQVYSGGQLLTHCVHVDTALNEAQCITQPLTIEGDHMKTHVAYGKIDIIWRSMSKPSPNGLVGNNTLFLAVKKEWEEREQSRIAS